MLLLLSFSTTVWCVNAEVTVAVVLCMYAFGFFLISLDADSSLLQLINDSFETAGLSTIDLANKRTQTNYHIHWDLQYNKEELTHAL